MIDTPFFIQQLKFFNEPKCLSILLEAALGGSLSHIYPQHNFYGSAEHTKYYIAGVVYALEFVHKRRLILRNLKPDAIVVDHLGHPKLCHLGLAKFGIGKSFTICGTPDYIAPEVLLGSGYARAVDWWAVGIIAFELMSGHTPFHAEHLMDIYSKIMRGMRKVHFPKTAKGTAKAFIENMCQLEPTERLPMRKDGLRKLMDHKWFAGFDWVSMKLMDVAPPWVPGVDNLPQVAQDKLPKPVKYNDADNNGWDSEWTAKWEL